METKEALSSQALVDECYHDRSRWKRLGSGGFRSAYQGPDGLAYKLNHNTHYINTPGYNFQENKTFDTLEALGFLWVPPHTLYTVKSSAGREDHVMVVPFLRDAQLTDYNEPGTENRRRYREIIRSVIDSGGGNLGVDPTTGLLYCRDGGNGVIL